MGKKITFVRRKTCDITILRRLARGTVARRPESEQNIHKSMIKNHLLLSAAVVCTLAAHAAVPARWCDSLAVEAATTVSATTNEKFNPHWLYSNQWGKYTQFNQGEGLIYLRSRLGIVRNDFFSLQAGLGVIGNANIDKSFVHEAYLRGKLWMVDFSAGLDAFTPVAIDDDLTTGSYLMSSNARPTPRAGIGIFDWWKVPFTFDLLQVRGGCYVGFLFNEDDKRFTDDVVTHEKFLYARLSRWNVKPYIGLIHSVMMGGTRPDGVKIPLDFWASFFGRNGSTEFVETGMRGEHTNAAGAHQGLWDLGVNFRVHNAECQIYTHRIFTDGKAKHRIYNGHDYIVGAYVKLPNKYLNNISLEYFTTEDQGGEGTPDPIGYDKNGQLLVVYPGDVPEKEPGFGEWIDAHFTPETVAEWEQKHHTTLTYDNSDDFLREIWNNGDGSGRKSYLNNGLYFQGWSVQGLSRGTSLFHSCRMVDRYVTDGKAMQNLCFFTNVRVVAVNIAANGSLTDRLRYRVKYTFTKNHGSLIEKFKGGAFGLSLFENYFYEKSKIEHYTLLSLKYEINRQFEVGADAACDFGKLYDTFGMRLGLVYRFSK